MNSQHKTFFLIALSNIFSLVLSVNSTTCYATIPKPALPLEQIAGLSLPFIANAGQTDPQVSFYAQTFAGTVYVTRKGELVYSLPPPQQGKQGWTLVERFEQGKAKPIGQEANVSQVSYIEDKKGKAVTRNAKTFGSLALGEAFPGVQVALKAHGKTVEKIYTLAPGADAKQIQMSIVGANSLKLDQHGNLLADTGNGPVSFSAPVAWQALNGKRHPVSVKYALQGKQYGYALGDYDHHKPVVIDPLLSATYLGGNSEDIAIDIAVHPISGDIYVLGKTLYPGSGFVNNFPGTGGGYQTSQTAISNNPEATYFLARLSSDLTKLFQSTYFETKLKKSIGIDGGISYDFPRFFIHGGNGDIYFWGRKNLSDSVSGMQNAALTLTDRTSQSSSTYRSYFVARFSSDLTQLKQATDLAYHTESYSTNGAREEHVTYLRDATFHPLNGDIYFTGSKDDKFVVLKVSEDLRSYVQEKVLGVSRYSSGNAIAIHKSSGDIYTHHL